MGLPIFFRRVPVNLFSIAPLDIGTLESAFSSSLTGKALVFKELDANLYAFHEKFLESRLFKMQYTEVMHGMLAFDQTEQQVIVRGYANWMLIVLTLGLAAFGLLVGGQAWLFTLFGLIAMGAAYASQANRYGKVAQTTATLAEAVRKAG